LSSKDDVGKSVHALEHTIRQITAENADLRTQIEELEDGLQLAEDNNLRLQVTLDSIKADNERQVSGKEEEYEEKRRNLNKKITDLEDELENERRAKV
jgi:myosin protein heavy chain